jgi:hypothetical protein
MRKPANPTEQEIIEGPQAVSFQIANGNVRQDCVLQTGLPTKVQAQKYLLTNWLIIEKMARDALAAGTLEDGQIKLVMVWAARQHWTSIFWFAGEVMLKDRENILNALREKPLKVYEIMRRANLPNEEACQSLLLKMRDEGLVKFDIHKGRWLIGWPATRILMQASKWNIYSGHGSFGSDWIRAEALFLSGCVFYRG